ncbi:MAG: hypothetical protein SX243_20710 [Acidobacteriota bacterium]|nr:hypothetical protein [Acidobacteriota bacterium]
MLFYGHPRIALGLQHLTSQCSQCWAVAEPLFRETGESLTPERAEELVRGLDQFLGHGGGGLDDERRQAPSRLEDLLAQPPGRRLLLVRNSARFRSPALADVLCQASRETAPRDAEEALELGELALEVIVHLNSEVYGSRIVEDLRAFAHAVMGNALRVTHRLVEAERNFRQAREHQRLGTGLLPISAEVDSLEASLHLTRRDFASAHKLLEEVREAFEELQDVRGLARTLLKEAHACREMGSSDEAARLFERAQQSLTETTHPRLMLCALHGRLASAVDLERFHEAESLLPQVRRLSEELGSSTDLLRLRWIEGELAAGMGRLEEAESIFETVKQELLAQGLQIDGALVSLHLGRVYQCQGRDQHLKQMVQEAAEIFRENRVATS